MELRTDDIVELPLTTGKKEVGVVGLVSDPNKEVGRDVNCEEV